MKQEEIDLEEVKGNDPSVNYHRGIDQGPRPQRIASYDPEGGHSLSLGNVSRSMSLPRNLRIPRAFRFKSNKQFNDDTSRHSAGGSSHATYPRMSRFSHTSASDRFKIVYINSIDETTGDRNGEFDYPSNLVCTSKYTWWSFVPVFLYLTFTKIANLYFLCVGIFQMIPEISPTNGIPLQFFPLAIVVLIDGIFAAFEDYKRHTADDEANSAEIHRLNRELREFESVEWKELHVGDIVKVYNRQVIPADLLILAVGEAEGQFSSLPSCFVETKSLDGETNLKLREAPQVTGNEFQSEEECGESIRGVLECEMPNGDINHFSGTLYVEGLENEPGSPVDLNNMLLRGCKLRNTHHIYGLVVNTGVDTKIMMSSGDEFPVKQSTIEYMTNRQVAIVVLLLICFCFLGAIGNEIFTTKQSAWYLGDHFTFAEMFFNIMTTLATMVPITLYVSITVVKAMQVHLMQKDLKMYDETTDSPMQARNMQLNEQLGQISHIFSDKTGTLTCNKMEFRKCSINGISYGIGTTAIGLAAKLRDDYEESSAEEHSPKTSYVEMPEEPLPTEANVNFQDPTLFADMKGQRGGEHQQRIEAFFTHLALCHSVLIEHCDEDMCDETMPTGDEVQNEIPSNLMYSASSPDEQALVSAAKYFGYTYVNRVPGSVTIGIPNGSFVRYNVLQVFEFDSTRKRMTVIVQQEGENQPIQVLCKGADNVVYSRLSSSPYNEAIRGPTTKHMDKHARDGLRTLVIAGKIISQEQWETFEERYNQVTSNLVEVELKQKGLDNEIDRLQDEMERDFEIYGSTAIEDRLQDGVPDTMAKLALAGINIWVLTGDQQDTAINIGYACRLLNNDMERIVINSKLYSTRDEILQYLDERYHQRRQQLHEESISDEIALVIDGASLGLILDDDYKLNLLRFSLLCKVVVACRVSPQQKAQLVALVKNNCTRVRTLAIGDGANDVPMIQAAHVGVGVIGEEGMQAVNNSDFALGQFRFLLPLLLVHGRWNYYRIAHLIVYTFYKNVAYCTAMFWYIFRLSGFSGTMIYSAFIQQGYNLFFTAVPIVVYAVTDQDVSAEMALKHPQLYHTGPADRFFNYTVFWKWIILGMVDSIFILYLPTYGVGWGFADGRGAEYLVIGSLGWTVLCVVVNLRFALLVNNWHWIEVAGLAFSFVSTYFFQYLVDEIDWPYDTDSFPYLLEQGQFWLIQMLTIVVVLSKDFLWLGYKRAFRPEYYHLVQEVQQRKLHDLLEDWKPPVRTPEEFHVLDYNSKRESQEEAVKRVAPGRSDTYRGFAFDQPATLIDWLIANPINNIAGPLLRRGRATVDVRLFVFESHDPVIFENQRFQPFAGFGSSYPGHLLPTDRSRWSDRSGKLHSMEMDTTDLEVNLNVPNADKNGWVYARDFVEFGKRESRHRRGLVRRRQWILPTGVRPSQTSEED